MSAPDAIHALIQEAIEAGRVTRVPTGAGSIVRKPKDERPAKFHPESCGKGGLISRNRFLDEVDGDWS